ncbi:MAG: hypothetical protein J6D27_04940 [Ruminiclostridium sp.]|nr:hypothetical protein [Ruminiclostridium sp.]
MLNFMYDNKGAVSIFLVLILVPMLMISAVFVDMGRLKLANSVAEASGELTLNTALTNYDAVLKNMYGLFATSQNTEELFDNLENYYRQSIESAGVSEPEAESYVQQIMQLLKTETGNSDLMNMQLTGFEVIKPTGGCLANPAVLKSQIVEFMKYRGPINLGTGIFDALSNFKNMKKQTDLINKKTTFYNSHISMMERLELIWRTIEDYQYADAYAYYEVNGAKTPATFPDGSLIEKRAQYLTDAKKNMDLAMEYYVRYVHYGKKINAAKNEFANYKVTQQNITSDQTVNGKKVKAGDKLFHVYNGDPNNYTTYVLEATPDENTDFEGLKELMQGGFTAIQALEKENKQATALYTGDAALTDTHKIKILSDAADLAGSSGTYHNKIKNLVNCLVAMDNHYRGYVAGKKSEASSQTNTDTNTNTDTDTDTDTDTQSVEDQLKETYAVIETVNNTKTITKFITKAEKDSGNYKSAPSMAELLDTVNYSGAWVNSHLHAFDETDTSNFDKNKISYIEMYTILMKRGAKYWNESIEVYKKATFLVGQFFNEARIDAENFRLFLNTKIDLLQSAIDELNKIKNDLDNPASDYNQAMANWKQSSDQLPGDNMALSDQKEMEKLKKELNSSDIGALVTRITAAKTSLETVRNQVSNHTVFGTKWYEMAVSGGETTAGSVRTMMSDTLKSIIEKASLTSNTNNHKTEDVGGVTGTYDVSQNAAITNLKAQIKTVTVTTSWMPNDPKNSPNLQHEKTRMYTWLYGNFYKESDVVSKYAPGEYNLKNKSNATLGETKDQQIAGKEGEAKDVQHEWEKKATDYSDKSAPKIEPPKREYLKDTLPSNDQMFADMLKDLGIKGEISKKKAEGEDKETIDSDSMMSGSTGALEMFKDLADAAANMATDLRDDMYIVNYIMNMFSHSAYENEIAVKFGEKSGKLFGSWYEVDSEGKYVYTQAFKDRPKFHDMVKEARTLTNVPIEPNINFMYGKEIEYIIYGDGGVEKTYGTIFLIRFALNVVYAFTDAEITNMAMAAATALFSVPPLTPLIPIAKIAIIIGVAIAESAFDLYSLKCGEKIPLFKGKNTWIMKPSSALQAVVEEVTEEAIDAFVDEGVKLLDTALEMTNDELQNMIDKDKDALKKISEAAINSATDEVKNHANQALQEVVTLCNNIRDEALGEPVSMEDMTQGIIKGLDEWLAKAKESDGADSPIYAAKKAAVDYLKDTSTGAIKDIVEAVENKLNLQSPEEIANNTMDVLNGISDSINKKINGLIDTAGNALSNLKNDMLKELEEAAKEGAEKLRATLKEKVGSLFGSSNNKASADISSKNVMSTLLEWSYSDYLQIFLLVGVIASPDTVLLRTGDIIQLNMWQARNETGFIEAEEEVEVSRFFGLIKETEMQTVKKPNPKAFRLTNAYTYLQINAYIDVKPLLMTLPFMAETTENGLSGTDWYQIKYEGTLGY